MLEASTGPVNRNAEDFAQRGFRVVRGAVHRPEAEALREGILRWEATSANAPETEYGLLRHDVWQRIDALAAAIHQGVLGRLAVDTLGRPQLRLFQDVVVWKTASAAAGVFWHQDYTYWPLDRPDGVVLWLALDPADPLNGGLRVAPGSHRAPDFTPPTAHSEAKEEGCVDLTVEPGDVVLLDPLLWHTSPPLTTAARRIAWITTWIDPAVKWDLLRANHPYRYTLEPADGTAVEGDRFPAFECTAAKRPPTG